MKLVLAASTADVKSGLQDAAYEAVKTLVFVFPETIVPSIVDQIKADMDAKLLNALTETDIAIYNTEEGKTYVDGKCHIIIYGFYSCLTAYLVLTSSKTDVQPTKGKDAAMAKWDAETRKALANKKVTGTPTLTKQQHALGQQQLEKERVVRSNVTKVKAQVERGLHLVNSLTAVNPPEFKEHLYEVLEVLLDGPLDRGSQLIGSLGYQTYLVSGFAPSAVSSRLI